MPSWELFEEQSQNYRDDVLPQQIWRRITIEAGRSLGWERYAGPKGIIIGLDHFGASAPGNVMMEKLGFTADHVIAAAEKLLRQNDG